MLYRKITLPLLFSFASLLFAAVPARAEGVTVRGSDYRDLHDHDRVASAAFHRAAPFRDAVLEAHNVERARWRVPALVWDEGLANDALSHALQLARMGYLRHTDMTGWVKPQGENLWMGTRGAFSYGEMMDGFLSERSDYIAGAMPNISRTGNWSDTGHYSQIIWRMTTAVGCAVASSKDFDFLVCRYDPAGNVWGRRANDVDRGARTIAMTGF